MHTPADTGSSEQADVPQSGRSTQRDTIEAGEETDEIPKEDVSILVHEEATADPADTHKEGEAPPEQCSSSSAN